MPWDVLLPPPSQLFFQLCDASFSRLPCRSLCLPCRSLCLPCRSLCLPCRSLRFLPRWQ